ncbi:hypothetical protein FDG2_5227 [Candidatus Protofrankia californiensis]|uniref:Uncharacterized protein n=1 Tax=Candidatus Protofrankia californiensis TaxID=1839754 RepID=A0A1C3PBP0_9ACTN|nr:hypothetical protein FDG2_5227 [Candidatus Protofrankia californiensis]
MSLQRSIVPKSQRQHDHASFVLPEARLSQATKVKRAGRQMGEHGSVPYEGTSYEGTSHERASYEGTW